MVQKVIKLSIIVPFFNVDRYAPENLASLAQNASSDIESGDCTCTHARFAVVGLHGVRYRRDVSASLTQLRDERQFDFITAFERIVQQARAGRYAASLLPKAVRSFCAVVCHHIGLVDHSTRIATQAAGSDSRLTRSATGRSPASDDRGPGR
jgi:hypothetical protein